MAESPKHKNQDESPEFFDNQDDFSNKNEVLYNQ